VVRRHNETSWLGTRHGSRHQPTIAAALDALDTTANSFAETGALRASGPPRGRSVDRAPDVARGRHEERYRSVSSKPQTALSPWNWSNGCIC